MNASTILPLKTLLLASVLGCGHGAFAQINHPIGILKPGDTVTITYDVTITSPLSGVTQLSRQDTVSGGNFTAVSTDDPETATLDDPTVTALLPNLDGPLNAPPVAPPQTFVRAPGLTLKIKIPDVLAACSDPDGGTPTLDSVGASVQSATISRTATHILYSLAANANDSFPYAIRDGQGGTNTGTISVHVVSPGGLVQSIVPGAGSVTVNCAGIPGFTYDIQRATNSAGPWATVATQTAPANGLFSYTDPSPPIPTAFYRLMQHVAP